MGIAIKAASFHIAASGDPLPFVSTLTLYIHCNAFSRRFLHGSESLIVYAPSVLTEHSSVSKCVVANGLFSLCILVF